MGFITEQEDGALAIEHMILHVVGTGSSFAPQPEMPVEQEAFFLERLRKSAVDGVHIFNDNSHVKSIVEQISSKNIQFENGGQDLSKSFSNFHVGSSTEGAFFIFQIATHDSNIKLFSLIKYDYHLAIELVTGKGTQHLREVVQAFVKDPRAIQKSCLIRVRKGTADDLVSAFDRMGRSPDLTDYFGRFLDVRRERSDDELSSALNELLRATLSGLRSHLPEQDVIAALDIGKDSLRGRDVVDDSAIREAIFVAAGRPDDQLIRDVLDSAINKELSRHRLNGVTFRPNPAMLAKRPRRRIKTAEGVTIVYPGEEDGHAVQIHSEDGGSLITIRTRAELVENATLPEGTRRATGPLERRGRPDSGN